MNRRDLLLLRTDPDRGVAELSCERLYMHYQHARLTMDRHAQPPAPDPRELWNDEPSAVFDERTTEQLFSDVDRELGNAEVVRVVDTGWLAVDAFRRDVEDLLAAFRRRGGRVEYQASVPRHAPIPHG
ncbi:MAG: hypothetical protein MK486_19990 [Gemmatimonadetes bacterium]|nr:hypothetical protein [Gemmatimonadota bacterium]